jgi:hypothetical protein
MFNNKWDKLGEKIDSKILAKKRRLIRDKFNANNSVPVVFDSSFVEDTIEGSSGGWYTKGGSPIRFPSAYSKKGRSNMVYKRSSLIIKAKG